MRAVELKIPPVGVFLLTGLLMWGAANVLPAAGFNLPGGRYVIGLLLAAGGIVGVGAVVAFRRRRTTVDPIQPQKASSLVIDNVFRYTRNPMYLGLVLVLGAWAVYLSNLASLVMLPVFIAYLTRFQIQPDERVLLEKFGDDFEQYMRKVRRWI